MLGRQVEIKPLGQLGQYLGFPSTSLLLHFFNDNELSSWKSAFFNFLEQGQFWSKNFFFLSVTLFTHHFLHQNTLETSQINIVILHNRVATIFGKSFMFFGCLFNCRMNLFHNIYAQLTMNNFRRKNLKNAIFEFE